MAHPPTHVFALGASAELSHLRGEVRTAQERAAKLLESATEQGSPDWAAEGLIRYGHALAFQEVGEAGLVAEAFERVEKTGEWYCEAELYRLKGELTLQESKVESHKPVLSRVEGAQVEEEAEACFHKAIEIAQKQQAKSWELRAATSLARLWQSQGKTTEAHAFLVPVYNWFTEGFDTADLKDAKLLLDALSEGR